MTDLRAPATHVTQVSSRVYTIPTSSREADGTLAWDATTMVLVQVEAAGHTGTGWTYGPAACASLVDDTLAAVVAGVDALDVTAAYRAMVDQVRNIGRPGVASMAISAVDTALWDLKARILEVPLHHLLGAVRDVVPVYGSGGFTTYGDEQLRDQLTGWVEAGIPRVKIKIGEAWGTRTDRDVERIRQTRAVVGDDVEVFVDANGAYTPAQAIDVARRVEQSRIAWFEEPVTSDDLDGLARVRAAVRADVTAGEYAYDLSYVTRMCAAQCVDCLQLDVTRCGGYTEWLRCSAVAAGFHLEVSGHCAPSLHLPVAAATPNLRHLEWFHDHVRIESWFFEGFPDPSGGGLRPSPSPGHGLTLRQSETDRFRVA